MQVKPKRRNVTENGGVGGDELVLATSIGNGEDLAPLVRHAFEVGKPETLLHQLKNVVRKKDVEIEDLCKLHYEDFIVAVDELRGVLVDADELKNSLQSENFRLQEVGSALLLKLEELLESYSIKKNVTEDIQMSKVCIHVLNLCLKCKNRLLQLNSDWEISSTQPLSSLIRPFLLKLLDISLWKIEPYELLEDSCQPVRWKLYGILL